MARNIRSRTFTLELYPDSESYSCSDILNFITSNYNYAYILHDKDIWDKDVIENGNIKYHKGELKKAHYHILLSFKNGRSIDSIKEDIGSDIHVETANFYAYTRYLIHLGYPNKFQYSKENIITNISTRVENALKRDYNSQEQDTRILLDFIFSQTNQSFLTFKQLTEFAIENDCLLDLKRNTYFYKSFCDDFGFNRWGGIK